jgi:methyl-accepting chemotaxis protein
MDEIVASVRRVSDVIGEITAASVEQSAGIEEVNQAIVQMDAVTQQNAALVEQSAAAAESMQQQAASLAEVVSVFRTGELARAVSKPASAPAPRPAVVRKPAPAMAVAVRKPAVRAAKEPANTEWEEF